MYKKIEEGSNLKIVTVGYGKLVTVVFTIPTVLVAIKALHLHYIVSLFFQNSSF